MKKLTKVMFQVQIGQATTHSFNDITSIIRYVLWTFNMLHDQMFRGLLHIFLRLNLCCCCCFTINYPFAYVNTITNQLGEKIRCMGK